MTVTILLTVIMCVLLFLMIWSAAFFLPWKRLMKHHYLLVFNVMRSGASMILQ